MQQYGIYEILLNVKNLLITKIFFPKARLIRYPFYIRNKKNIKINDGFTCGYNCRLESIKTKEEFGKILLGINVKVGDNVHLASASEVKIEDNVLIASHVFISDLDHGNYSNSNQTSPSIIPDKRDISSKKILIKENTWIGENVVILKGVTIGKGCVIGANTLINKNIPDYSIAVGQPAKVIKKYNFETEKWEKIYD